MRQKLDQVVEPGRCGGRKGILNESRVEGQDAVVEAGKMRLLTDRCWKAWRCCAKLGSQEKLSEVQQHQEMPEDTQK